MTTGDDSSPNPKRRASNDSGPNDDSQRKSSRRRPPPSDPAETLPLDRAPDETIAFEPPGGDSPLATDPPSGSGTDPLGIPRRIGPFRVCGPIATGGMGAVYEAEQDNPRRSVALKVLRSEMSTPEIVRRFEYETQILAQLRHPGIAQIYEAGTFEVDGRVRPYYAMELIDGARPLGRYCDDAKLNLRERLALFAEITDAVHHGHQRGVIHRDLKPANILVDGDGHPKIIDFGVARAVDNEREPTTAHTSIGQLVGTLQYMSPEQVGGDPTEIDIRSDVYALGVVLYELLTSKYPYDLTGRAIYEATQLIREEIPARPSTRVATLRGDVETITLKALEKEKDRRYATAHDLGEDIRRYLRGDAIQARPPSLTYQLTMLARRHRAFALALVTITLVTMAAFATTVWALLRSLDQETATTREHTRSIEATADAERERRAAERSAYRAAIAAANTALKDRDISSTRRHINSAPVAHRGWEWRYLRAQSEPRRPSLVGHRAPVRRVAFSPDATTALSVDDSGEYLLWSLPEGRLIGPVEDADFRRNTPLSYFDDTHFVAVTESNRLGLFDTRTRRLGTEHFELGPSFDTYAMSANREVIAIGSGSELTVWKLGEEAPLKKISLTGGAVAVALDATGRYLAVRDRSARFWMWKLEVGQPLIVMDDSRRGMQSAVVEFDPVRDELAESADDLTVRIRSVKTGDIVRRLLGHTDAVTSLAYDPTGTWLATTSKDSSVRLWHAADGIPGPVLVGHRAATTSVAFSSDGRTLISGSADGTVRLWDIAAATPTREHSSRLIRVSPNGQWEIRQRPFNLQVDLIRLSNGEETPIESDVTLTTVDFSDDGGRVVLGFDTGMVQLGTLPTDGSAPRFAATQTKLHHEIKSARLSPDGQWVVVSCADGHVDVLSADGGTRLASLDPTSGDASEVDRATSALDIHPLGRELVVGRTDGSVELWRRDDIAIDAAWTLRQRWFMKRGPCSAAYFTADGHSIVALFGTERDQRRQVVTWNTETNLPLVRSLGIFPAWNMVSNPDRDRFFVSLGNPARIVVLAPNHEDPLLSIGGRLAQTYRFAGFEGRSALHVYDDRGTRVELRTIDPDDEREQNHDTLRLWADQLLSEELFIERAVLRLREDRRLFDWARELAYFRILARGQTMAQRRETLLARSLEPRGTWIDPEEPLRYARALADYAPDDPETMLLFALVHYRANQSDKALLILNSIGQDARNSNTTALTALVLADLDRTDEARLLMTDILQTSAQGTMDIHQQFTFEMTEIFGRRDGGTGGPE